MQKAASLGKRQPPNSRVSGYEAHSKPRGLLLPVSNPLDAIAHHVDGTFVLVVKVSGGKYRRRCFLSAASAERAARNALEAGHNPEVFLAELKPLWKLKSVPADLDLGGE
jgi:hypothetical protein